MTTDPNLTIHGYAMMKDPTSLLSKLVTPKFEPYSYHPRPLGDNEIEVAITHCGICGSDIHTAFGGWGKIDYPIIVGHEIVGNITAKGSKVEGFEIGDRVGCGAHCYACLNKGPAPCNDCATGNENHCERVIGTYNGKYPDGEPSMGGYASHKRFAASHAFHIPANISSAEAAPLLCAGATVYSPLKRYNCGPGVKVAVVGIGGLGHLAVQYAHKMGAEVICVTSSKGKTDLCKKLGADDVISMSDQTAVAKYRRTQDLVIIAANGQNMDWDAYMSLCKLDAHFVLVALPEDELKVKPFTLTKYRARIVGSNVGSLAEIKDMIEFSSKHDVRPMIEILPMSQCNEGIRKVRENDVKFRVVLEQGK